MPEALVGEGEHVGVKTDLGHLSRPGTDEHVGVQGSDLVGLEHEVVPGDLHPTVHQTVDAVRAVAGEVE